MRAASDKATLNFAVMSPEEYMAELYLYLNDYGVQQGFRRAEIDAIYMTIWTESSGQFKADAKTSSAYGAAQTIGSTRANLIASSEAYDDTLPLEHPFNQAVLTVDLARETLNALPQYMKNRGLTVAQVAPFIDAGIFKIQHKLGGSDMANILQAAAEGSQAPLSEIISADAIRSNSSLKLSSAPNKALSDWTAKEYLQWAREILGRADYLDAASASLQLVDADLSADAIREKITASLNVGSVNVTPPSQQAPSRSLRPVARPENILAPPSPSPEDMLLANAADAPVEAPEQLSYRPTAADQPPPDETQQAGYVGGMVAGWLNGWKDSQYNPNGLMKPTPLMAASLSGNLGGDEGIQRLIDGAEPDALDRVKAIDISHVAGVVVINPYTKELNLHRIAHMPEDAKKAAINCVWKESGGRPLGAVESTAKAGQLDIVFEASEGFEPEICNPSIAPHLDASLPPARDGGGRG